MSTNTKNQLEVITIQAKHETENDYLLNKLMDVIRTKGKQDYNYVLEYIKNEIEESTRVIDFNYDFKCFLEDGAYAISRAVEDIVGFSKQKDEKAPSGKNPPIMLNVRLSDGTIKTVPFGQVVLPKYGKDAFIEMSYDDNNNVFHVKGRCEKRYKKDLDTIITKAIAYIKTDSIYRNQAIKIEKRGVSPEFIDLSRINETNLFLTPEAQFATTPIEARIEKTAVCIKNNIDIKFGAILAGTFGVGKTLYAFKLAYKAILNGWSFIYCPKPENILYVMNVASMLADNGSGVIIFCEDKIQK